MSKYNFISIADIHWGAMDSDDTYNNLLDIIEYVNNNKIDFIVITGDYFDHRIQLNSRAAILAMDWFDLLVNTAKANNVSKIRIIRGTKEHDNDQLEIFRHYETEDSFIKIYNTNTIEQLYPDLKCVFCPDENLNPRDYQMEYIQNMTTTADIGFFHGNFDNVLPQIKYDEIMSNNLPTMVFPYQGLYNFITGPMIAGHWHTYTNIGKLYYGGSYDRWKFGEDEDKGFLFGTYNTDDGIYEVSRVINTKAKIYETIVCSMDDISTPSDFSELSFQIKNRLSKNDNLIIKVQYIITTDNSEGIVNFDSFKRHFAYNKNVKVKSINMITKEAKKVAHEKITIDLKKYPYVFDKNIDIVDKIHNFILDRKDKIVDKEFISDLVSKYL